MDKKPPPQERKAPKKISKKYLENAALYYLQRYATSAENLRRVLMRKVKKSCAFHQVPVEDFAPLVDELVTRYMSVGLVDDTVFARARVTSLRRQGLSKQAIMARLQAKGLSKTQIESALRLVDEEHEDPEMAAAIACARRKKLGPWRKKPLTDPKDRQKELAALGRAGFSYEIARRALSGEEED
jgi:regulatory protein